MTTAPTLRPLGIGRDPHLRPWPRSHPHTTEVAP